MADIPLAHLLVAVIHLVGWTGRLWYPWWNRFWIWIIHYVFFSFILVPGPVPNRLYREFWAKRLQPAFCADSIVDRGMCWLNPHPCVQFHGTATKTSCNCDGWHAMSWTLWDDLIQRLKALKADPAIYVYIYVYIYIYIANGNYTVVYNNMTHIK